MGNHPRGGARAIAAISLQWARCCCATGLGTAAAAPWATGWAFGGAAQPVRRGPARCMPRAEPELTVAILSPTTAVEAAENSATVRAHPRPVGGAYAPLAVPTANWVCVARLHGRLGAQGIKWPRWRFGPGSGRQCTALR